MNQQLLRQATAALAAGRLKITCAESCTGGLLAAAFTELPGSSAWFETGFVTYSNEAKTAALGRVRREPAARRRSERNRGAGNGRRRVRRRRRRLRSRHHRHRRPRRRQRGKPVGTVCFGLACREGASTRTAHFCGTRSEIRRQAADFAIAWLAQTLAQRQG